MPGADDILSAMREAGAEFARMADTIESRLPAIGEALSKAPAHLRPLKNGLEEVARIAAGISVDRLVGQLGEAGTASAALLKSMVAVQDALDTVSGKAASAASAYFDITAEAKRSAKQVDELTARMDKFGDSLAKRNDQAEELHRRVRDAAEKFVPARAETGGLRRRAAGAAVGDEPTKRIAGFIEEMQRLGRTSEEVAALVKERFGDLDRPLADVQHNFAEMEAAVQGLSGPINQARVDLEKMAPEEMESWGRSAAAAVGEMARQAEAMPDISPVGAADLRRLQTALITMDKMADKPDKMRAAMRKFRKEIEGVKNVGSAFNRELGQQIEHLSDETRRWYGLSFKDARELAGWQAKHIRAAELNIQKGMNATYAYGMELGRALKDMPIPAVRKEVDQLGRLTHGLLGDLTKMDSFTYTGLAKAFISVGDEVKADRRELIKLTAEAGMLSAMLRAGMGATEMTAEFEKLRQSMNNMLNRWGKTREESIAAMRALTDAGFSMSSIMGPTLKETESGLFAFARAGEYAMTGLESIAKVSAMTGKSMEEVAALAGQWRERLGVSISQVGETYLELESAARRSGLSVGKFMDRVMSSASGFVMFGGQVDDVAESLSSMMAGMRLPPGLAADVASDFMQRLSGITMEEAMTGVALVGKAGTDAMLKSAQSFKDQRDKDAEQIKREMAQLDASGLQKSDYDAYSQKKGDLQAALDKAEEDRGTYAALLVKAAQGDAVAASSLYEEEAMRGHSSARLLRLGADAAAMGIDMEKLAAKKGSTEQALFDELLEMERTSKDRVRLDQGARAAGHKSFKEMKEIVRGAAREAEVREKWAEALGIKGEKEKEAFGIMADTGDLEAISRTLKEKGVGPDEVLKMMQRMQGEGLAVSEATIEGLRASKKEYDKAISDFGEESEQAREAAERMKETAAAAIAGKAVAAKTPEERIADFAKQQTGYQQKISEAIDSIRKFLGSELLAVLLAIKVAMDVGAFWNFGANLLSRKLPGGKLFKGATDAFSKVFTKGGRARLKAASALKDAAKLRLAARGAALAADASPGSARLAAKAERLAAKAARSKDAWRAAKAASKSLEALGPQTGRFGSLLAKAGTQATKFGSGLLSAGKTAMRFAGRLAGPLAAGVEAVFAWMEISSKKQAAYQDAYNRALAQGKDEAESKEIADRAAARAVTRGDVGRVAGQVAGASTGAIIGGIVGVIGGPIGVAAGMAIGGWLGGKGGAWLGETIGNALETEARAFDRAIEEVIDLGTLADAQALVNKEKAERDALQREKMDLIKKEARGEELTSAERDRLRELKRKLIEKETNIIAAESTAHQKGSEEDRKAAEERMSAENKVGWLARKRMNQLEDKKREQGKLSDAEEMEYRQQRQISKLSNAGAKAYLAGQAKEKQQKKIQELEREKEGITRLAGKGGLSKADQDEIARITKELEAAKSASPLSVGGPAVAAPLVPTPEARDMVADAARMQAARDGEKAAAGAGAAAANTVTDNSTWNVHINSRSEKELQDAMLKTMIKHQQRLAN